MKKYIVTLVILFLVTQLVGCIKTVNGHRNWVLCKEESGVKYYYNDIGEFKCVKNSNILAHSGAGLQSYPALSVIPSSHSYSFSYILPGLFEGTLYDVEGYIADLLENGYTSHEVVFKDNASAEVYVHSDKSSVRILFTINGDVRIYESTGKVPPLLDKY